MKPYQEQGNTISFLILENHLAAIVALGDVVKQKKEFIRTLKERKSLLSCLLVTKNAAQAVADYLGIEEYYGGLLPDDKEAVVQKYLDQGKK